MRKLNFWPNISNIKIHSTKINFKCISKTNKNIDKNKFEFRKKKE